MINRWISVSCFLFITSLLVYWIFDSSLVTSYITAVKEQKSISVLEPVNSNQQLYERIKKEAPRSTIPPQNARIDPVWKAAVPGYNGRQVDINATFNKTMKQGDNKIYWCFRETLPQKRLEDFRNYPIYRGNENKKAVALMINVAWGTEHIGPMLEILKNKKSKATFFFDGSWLKENPEVAKKIQAAGHEIGNHAYSHQLMAQITSDRITEEIRRTEELIYQTLHIHSTNFAPPAGSFDQRTVDIAQQMKMRTVLWTVDTIDWKKSSSPQLMLQRVEKKVAQGSLVLMHPTDRTVQALPGIIDYIKKKQWQLLTVADVLSSKRVD